MQIMLQIVDTPYSLARQTNDQDLYKIRVPACIWRLIFHNWWLVVSCPDPPTKKSRKGLDKINVDRAVSLRNALRNAMIEVLVCVN